MKTAIVEPAGFFLLCPECNHPLKSPKGGNRQMHLDDLLCADGRLRKKLACPECHAWVAIPRGIGRKFQ